MLTVMQCICQLRLLSVGKRPVSCLRQNKTRLRAGFACVSRLVCVIQSGAIQLRSAMWATVCLYWNGSETHRAIFGFWSRFRYRWFVHFIHSTHQHEDGGAHNHKLNDGIDEQPLIQSHCTSSFGCCNGGVITRTFGTIF